MVQGLKVTLGISQQADRSLRYKEMNGYSNELMGRFLPGLHAQEYHLATLTAALQVDALSIYYAMVRFMPELQKAELTQVCCSGLLVDDSLLYSSSSPEPEFTPSWLFSLVTSACIFSSSETYESSAFPFSL